MDDSLTREQIEAMRDYDPNHEGPLTRKGLRILRSICDLALRQDSSGGEEYDCLICGGVVHGPFKAPEVKLHHRHSGKRPSFPAIECPKCGYSAAPQESRSEVLEEAAKECDALGRMAPNQERGLGYDIAAKCIRELKRPQVTPLSANPALASAEPGAQLPEREMRNAASNIRSEIPSADSQSEGDVAPGVTAGETADPSVDYARGLEDAAKVCDAYAKEAEDALVHEKMYAAFGCADRIRAKIKPSDIALTGEWGQIKTCPVTNNSCSDIDCLHGCKIKPRIDEGEVSELSRPAQEALNDLAAGFKIKSEGSGWWPVLVYEQIKKISSPVIDELIKAGFIHGIANGSGFQISDEGRKAYLKSTDELGDGKVYLP